MSDIKPAKNPAPKVSTHRPIRGVSFENVPRGRGFLPLLTEMSRKRGFVTWLSGYVGIGLRELAYLARTGKIRGVVRSANGYNFDWGSDPSALAAWIRDRKRFRKGNRKRPKKRRNRASLLDQFSRAVHRAARLTTIDKIETLQEEIRRTARPRLQNIESSLNRLSRVRVTIARRLNSD